MACATENAEKPRAGFAEKHDKSCLQMPDCANSGYALLTADNQVLKFDAKGNAAAKELISSTKRDKDWRITVTGALNKDLLTVSDLKLD